VSALLRLLCIAAILVVSYLASARAELPYLYERLSKSPIYKKTLTALLAGKPTPTWVRGYLSGGNGVDTPGRDVRVGTAPYEMYAVCQPHNCAGNFLYVLFQPGGGAATALITMEGKSAQFFGNPNQPQKDVLIAGSKN
jgi:hypothetical protein